jgi:hypothetical protein
MGTYILGSQFTDDEVNEIMTDPAFRNTLAKNILDLRKANKEFVEALKQTWLFQTVEKIARCLCRWLG